MRSFRSLILIVTGMVLASVLAGCWEDADRRASRHAREAAEKASSLAEQGRFDEARAVISGVSPVALRSGSGELVAIVNGSLLLEQADRKLRGAQENAEPLNLVAAEVRAQLRILDRRIKDYMQLAIDHEAVVSSLKNTEDTVSALRAMLSEPNGLDVRLAQAQEEVGQLASQRQQVQEQVDLAISRANAVQARADELFGRAELAQGNEKHQLQQDAYAVILGQNGEPGRDALLVEAELTANGIKLLQNRLDMAQSKVDWIKSNIDNVGQRIVSLDDQDRKQQLNVLLNDLKARQRKAVNDVEAQIGESKKAAQAYTDIVTELADLYNRACSEYDKATAARGRTARLAQILAADSKHKSGYGMLAIAHESNSLRLQLASLKNAAQLMAAAVELGTMEAEMAAMARDSSETALKMFTGAVDNYRSVSGGSDTFRAHIVRSTILAYLQKIDMARALGDQEALAGAQLALQALADEARQLDERFGATATAAMLAEAIARTGMIINISPAPESDVFIAQDMTPEQIEAAKDIIKANIVNELQQAMYMQPQELQAWLAQFRAKMEAINFPPQEMAAVEAMLATGAIDDFTVDMLVEWTFDHDVQTMQGVQPDIRGATQEDFDHIPSELAKIFQEGLDFSALSPQQIDAIKGEMRSDIIEEIQGVFNMSAQERQAWFAEFKEAMEEAELPSHHISAMEKMLNSGVIDDAVIDMVVNASFDAVIEMFQQMQQAFQGMQDMQDLFSPDAMQWQMEVVNDPNS